MLTVVCRFKHLRHRVWEHLTARVGATHPLHAVCQSAGHLGVLGKSLHRRALSGGRSRVLVRRRHDGVRNSEQKCVEADRRVEYAVR